DNPALTIQLLSETDHSTYEHFIVSQINWQASNFMRVIMLNPYDFRGLKWLCLYLFEPHREPPHKHSWAKIDH
ncbi:MAG: hypothetical protein KAG53_11300, partial [Endozoicomonadaceae bacterium]|nr:hypothetical protein [Endozoicomonadaceae bacterium]